MLVPDLKKLKHFWVVFFCWFGLTSVASAAPSCRIPGGRTIATGQVAKLITVRAPAGRALFACIRRTGRKEYLDDDARAPRVAGRWVAWQRANDAERPRIVVHDLRTGRERLVVGRVAGRALVLTTRGTVAWVQRHLSRPETPLYANDTITGGSLLDGRDVDADSLRIAGRRVFWTAAGSQRSAVVR